MQKAEWIEHESTLGGGGTRGLSCLQTAVMRVAQQRWEAFVRERVARWSVAIRRRGDREAIRLPWRA
jgi:hypothetical protein